MVGGEATAFTTELEKARLEAIDRVRQKALSQGANVIVGLDLETSDLGLQAGIVVVSATGTAVIAEPEKSQCFYSSRALLLKFGFSQRFKAVGANWLKLGESGLAIRAIPRHTNSSS